MPNESEPYDEDAQFTTIEPPQMEPERASIVEKLLDSNKLLESIRYFMLGYYQNANNDLEQDETLRMVNDKGCRAILFEICQRITPQVVLGAITDVEAKDRARRFEISMAQKLVNNYIEWEVRNISALDIFVDSLGDLIFVALTRPIKGTAFSGIIDISQLRELRTERDILPTNEERERGMFKKTFSKFGGG